MDPSASTKSRSTLDAEKQKLAKIISQHRGNFKQLEVYSKELQTLVNVYLDSTKAPNAKNKGGEGFNCSWCTTMDGEKTSRYSTKK